jgi:hypothetical protein
MEVILSCVWANVDTVWIVNNNNLQVVTTINYNTVVGLHNLQTLHIILFTLSSVVFTYLQYNMGAVKVSRNYTLPMPYAFSVITNYH